MIKNKIAWIFLLNVIPVNCLHYAFSTALVKYEEALSDLIRAHQVIAPTEPISLQPGTMVFATYQKVIAPYVTYIKGYANVIQSEQARNLPYHDDLKKLFQEFIKYQKEVRRIAQYFPVAEQQAVLQAFYQGIGASVVQICFNIVQKISYALTIDPGVLASCYLAYQLVIEIYVPGMAITGIATGSDVSSTMANAMITLYQIAITQRKNELNTGLTHTGKVEELYQEIEAYYKILSIVYMDAGKGTLSGNMLQQVQVVQEQAKLYAQALSLYNQAQSIAEQARTVVILDPLNPTVVASSIMIAQQKSIKAYQLFQKAQAAYQEAFDPVGQQKCNQAMSTVTNIDMVVRFLEQLWSLYLTEQSSNNVITAPAIALFVQSNQSELVTLQDLMQALQNLIALISQSSNKVNQLATQTQLQQYSVTATINLLEQNILNASSQVTIDPLVSLVTVQQAQLALGYLQNMSQAILSACTKTEKNSVALAMTYAKEMDKLFAEKNRSALLSLVPYFPDQLSIGSTWTDWVAEIFFVAHIVSTKGQAYAQIGKAKITQPVTTVSAINVNNTIAQAINLKKNAVADVGVGNYVQATIDYQGAFTAYQSLYAAESDSAVAIRWYQQAMLMRTLFSASSFASMLEASGDVTWKMIEHIPRKYVATAYQFSQISMTDLGGKSVPDSLQSLAVGTSITTFTMQQEKDIFALIQAYMVNQILMIQGISFSECFVDYTLSLRPSISATAKVFAQQAIVQVQQTMNGFKDSSVKSILLQDADTISSVNCSNIPLSTVLPMYASMATAVTFLESAYTLYAPGKTNVNLGGTQYVPGNDVTFANAILEEMVYAYLSAGYYHWIEAKKTMALVHTGIAQGNTAISVKLPVNFADIFSLVNKNIIRAQALVYAPGQSAYAYALQLTNAAMSITVQQLFFSLYEEMIVWMKRCLVGDPFSSNYQMLLHQINTAYMNWASMLDPVKDATQINGFNLDIAQLFENAGTMCMETSYEETMYPGYRQMHYATAAHYFLAAQKKYTSLGHVKLADKMEVLMHAAYYKGSNQNIGLYFHVKKHGLSYVSQETGQVVPISVSQMVQDNVSGFVDGGEQNAYNSVKNLLLNAGMGFEFLANRKSQAVSKKKLALKTITTPKAKQEPSKIIIYLRNKNILDSNIFEIPYDQPGIVAKIFSTAADAYKKFENDPITLEAWMNTLLLAVQSLYAQDYMGIQGQQTGTQVAKQAQAFFQALQQESSSLENPSFAYVG